MQLSPGERLLAIMLADVMTHLKVTSDFEPEFLRNAINTGNTWAIADKYPGFQADDNATPDEIRQTRDAMVMWSLIERTVAALSPEDLERVEKETGRSAKDLRFPGFDGNGEYNHMSAARFMIEQMGDFPEFQERNLNSHSATVETTSRMLPAFNQAVMRMGNTGVLTVDDLIAVIKARRHPDA